MCFVLAVMWLGPTITLSLVAGLVSHDCERWVWFLATLVAGLPPLGFEIFNVVHAATSHTGVCNDPPDIWFTCSYSEHIVHEVSPLAGWNGIGMAALGVPIFVWGILVGLVGLVLALTQRASCRTQGCRAFIRLGDSAHAP